MLLLALMPAVVATSPQKVIVEFFGEAV